MDRRKWTREEEIIVFNLYCKIPFQHSSKNHPDVIKIANLIGRTTSAVNMKIGNLGSFDVQLKNQGIVGLRNASKLDKEIWDEFNGKWDELAFESEKIIAELENRNSKLAENIPKGFDKAITLKQRVNQNFFRSAVLASYRNVCCITGISTPQLLIASHIKPWSKSNESEKTNPRNGLSLNALHDAAFDKGFLTVTPEYKIIVSDKIRDIYDGNTVNRFFKCYNGTSIILPEKFLPNKDFLIYHNDMIFEK